MEAVAAAIGGPIVAGVIVSLLNRYVLDFRWCAVVEEAVCDSDSEDSNDSTPSQSAVNSDAIMTHHCVLAHVH